MATRSGLFGCSGRCHRTGQSEAARAARRAGSRLERSRELTRASARRAAAASSASSPPSMTRSMAETVSTGLIVHRLGLGRPRPRPGSSSDRLLGLRRRPRQPGRGRRFLRARRLRALGARASATSTPGSGSSTSGDRLGSRDLDVRRELLGLDDRLGLRLRSTSAARVDAPRPRTGAAPRTGCARRGAGLAIARARRSAARPRPLRHRGDLGLGATRRSCRRPGRRGDRGARPSPASRSARRGRGTARRPRAARCAARPRACPRRRRRRAPRAASSALADRLPAARLAREVVVERPAEHHGLERRAELATCDAERSGRGEDQRRAPAPTITRSISAASTRRLSSLVPETGRRLHVAIGVHHALDRHARSVSLGPQGPAGRRSRHDPANGARRRGRHGLELLASGGVRLRAGDPLVEPRGRDPRGGAHRRRHGRGAACCSPSGSTARCTPRPSSTRSAAPPGSSRSRRWPRARSATPPTATSCSTRSARARASAARDQRPRGGPLRLARDRQLHDDRGRLRARHRRRQHPGHADRGPAAGRGGVAAARLRAGERGVPARARRRPRRGSRRCASAWRASSARSAGGAAAGGWWAWAARSATWPRRR